jgi:thiol-disulfide isomerase/thioredoxin
MSLVPLNVPQDRRSKYEQLFAISQLKINVQQFLRPAQLDEIDAIAALLSTATDALSALSFIVDFFIMMHAEQTNQSQFTSIPTSAASLVFGLAELFNSIQRIAPMVNELQQSYERSMILAAVDEPERLNAWQQAADPFLQHQTKFSRIATTLQRIKRGEAVTPQVLYTTALDLHASSLEFTRVRSRLNPQLVTELETYKGMEKWPKNFTGAGIVSAGAGAILLGCIASNPLGWAVATAFLGLGTLSTGTGGYQWMKVSNKRKAIRKVQQDLRDLASVFNEVRHDIAAFMCRTVLGIELDHLGDAEKRTFLESFAVDVDALHYQGYRESLVTSGIDKVLKYYDDLTTDFRQMVRHCGLDIDITETDQR